MAGRSRRIRFAAPDELTPLAPDEVRVVVDGDVPPAGWPRIAELLAGRPDVELSLQRGEDLEMLRWFPDLRRLTTGSLRLRSLDGLRHVAASLERLGVGDTLGRLSLRPVADLMNLRRLGVSGSWKDVDSIGRLTALERLGLGTVDIAWLLPLTALRRFTCGLGTITHLELLPEVGRLELVELWRLRGEHDLAPLGEMTSLRYLLLASTRSITSLPSFRKCLDLRWVALDEMHGITDLRPIADTPNLEVLLLIGMRKLPPEALQPLVGHPTLRAGIWGLCSDRRNRAAFDLLPLPPGIGGRLPWDEPGWDGVAHPNRS